MIWEGFRVCACGLNAPGIRQNRHALYSRHQSDPVKLHFVQSIQQIAENSGSRVIAEGIETSGELMVLKTSAYLMDRAISSRAQSKSGARHLCRGGKSARSSGIAVYPRGLTVARGFPPKNWPRKFRPYRRIH